MKNIPYIFIFTILVMTSSALANEVEFIWAEDHPDGSKIYTSEYREGEWQEKTLIAEDENLNILPALGSDSKTNRLAVWVTITPNGNSVLKFSFKREGDWQHSRILTNLFKTNLAPVIIFDSQDSAWVFWSANDGNDDDIYMSHIANNRWIQPVEINSDNDVPDILPKAGLDESDNIWVSWQQLQDDMTYREVSKKLVDGNWTGAQKHQIKIQEDKSEFEHLTPPPFFQGRSRATFHFPNNKRNQSATIMGVE